VFVCERVCTLAALCRADLADGELLLGIVGSRAFTMFIRALRFDWRQWWDAIRSVRGMAVSIHVRCIAVRGGVGDGGG
jgi:hypothetical protein